MTIDPTDTSRAAAPQSLKSELEEIQTLMTQHFKARLLSGDITPTELNTVRQLLKDNNIVVELENSEGLGTLGALLPEFHEDDEQRGEMSIEPGSITFN